LLTLLPARRRAVALIVFPTFVVQVIVGIFAMAHHATHGNLAIQLCDIERQAGVRRTL
jgi:hypothetical protein